MKPITISGLLPIVLSTSVLQPSPSFQTIRYNDISNNTPEISNPTTLNHLSTVQESHYFGLLLRINFYDHVRKWEHSIRFYSSPNQIVQDEDFKAIVKMGEPVIPLIVHEIERQPSFLVWALNLILGFKISDSSDTTIPEACKLWVKYLSSN